MNKPIFTAKDFTLGSNEVYLSDETAAKIANEKIQKLIESWPVVYANYRGPTETHSWNDNRNTIYSKEATHTARLAFIEEIKPKECQHEPYLFSVNAIYRPDGRLPEDENYKCRKCGVSLKQKWEALDV